MNTTTGETIIQQLDLVLSHIPLAIISLGLLFNTASFLILRLNRELNKMSSMVYLSFAVLIDTVSLFTWNLDHYTKPNAGFTLTSLNLPTCRMFTFAQYYSLQCSAFLLSLVSVDRYVVVRTFPGSVYNKLPFATVKSAYGWCAGVMLLIFLVNGHILVLNGYQDPLTSRNNGTSNVTNNSSFLSQSQDIHCYSYSDSFNLVPLWDQVHMILYSFVPSSIMLFFNILLIFKTLYNKSGKNVIARITAVNNLVRKKRNITISLLVVTFSFMAMTLPSTIAWGFLRGWLEPLPYGILLLHLLDCIAFFNHASLFFMCLIWNKKFRSIVLGYLRGLCCGCCCVASSVSKNPTRTIFSRF